MFNKSNKYIALSCLILISSCASHSVDCSRNQPNYNKIVIVINTANILTADESLEKNYRESIKNIIETNWNMQLHDKFHKKINNNLIITNKQECDPQTLIVEGVITSIDKSVKIAPFMPIKSRYSISLQATIKYCSTGALITHKRIDDSDYDFQDLLDGLGTKLADFTYDALTACSAN